MFCLFLKPDGNDDHVTYTNELHFVLQSFETTSCNFTTHFIVYCLIYSAKYKPLFQLPSQRGGLFKDSFPNRLSP